MWFQYGVTTKYTATRIPVDEVSGCIKVENSVAAADGSWVRVGAADGTGVPEALFV